MSYSKDVGEVSARYRSAGEVPSVTYPSGTHVRFTAPGAATSGQYGLFEWNMTEAPGGPDPHFHKTFSESFYVMEGIVRLFNGKTWIDTAEHPSSDALHVTERLRYIDANHLEYEVTWDDPKTYTKPFKNTRIYVRMKPGEELMEWWCMENNKDLLEGHLSDSHTTQ